MKWVCIHQPDFLPHLGFFHRLLLTDVFIILDDVQFLRRGWHHRDKIKTRDGERWLSLSVKKGNYHQNIAEVQLSEERDKWVTEHINLLTEHYRKASYFDEYFPKIRDIYMTVFDRMIDLNLAFLKFFFEIFDIHIPIGFSSSFQVHRQKNDKLISLIHAVGGTHYLTGSGSKAYLEEAMFAQAGITVEWQQFQHPVYPQLHGDFIPNLSCIDILFNCGPEAKDILRGCKGTL